MEHFSDDNVSTNTSHKIKVRARAKYTPPHICCPVLLPKTSFRLAPSGNSLVQTLVGQLEFNRKVVNNEKGIEWLQEPLSNWLPRLADSRTTYA